MKVPSPRYPTHFRNKAICVLVSLLVLSASTRVFAQGETTSSIVGQLTDATNAAVADARVTIISRDTGLRRTVQSDGEGRFNFPQLRPGTYSVKAEAQGFEGYQIDNVAAGLGQKQTVNLVLKVAQASQSVEVSSEAPILNPENPNTSTTLSAQALENLPNPGGDLTYPLQFAAGALDQYRGKQQRFRRRIERLRQRRVQWTARARQRIHR